MDKNIDVFGQEVIAYYKGESVEEIIERNDGWIDTSMGPKTYFTDYKDWSVYYKKALKLFNYLFVSKDEFKKILKSTGWKVEKFINSGEAPYIAIIGKDN